MTMWRSFAIPYKYVISQNETKTCILLPENSVYMGYSTWVSNKLIRDTGEHYTLALKPGFDVYIEYTVKNDKGTFETLDKKIISGDTFKQLYKNA